MQNLYPRYDSFAGLNYLQRSVAVNRVGSRIPLVYGADVFVSQPPILSHKISVAGGRLQHEYIAAISYGATDDVGAIGLIDGSLYSSGLKLSTGTVSDSRPGSTIDTAYGSHPTVWRSIKVSGTSVTIPTKMSDGTKVISGRVLWLSGATWASAAGSPGQTITTASSASWVSVETNVPALYPSVATALTRVTTSEPTLDHPDIYVRKGRTIKRLIGAGRGPYAPTADHVIASGDSYLYDVQNDKSYKLPITTTIPDFDYDADWVVYRTGASDRYADVVNDLITNVVAGNSSISNPESLVDYSSFVKANAHAESLGLKFSGVIDDTISVLDFVTDYSMFFDLIPMRDRNRMSLIPHLTEDTYLLGLFTFFNCAEMRLDYLPFSTHDYKAVAASTHGGTLLSTYKGERQYSTSSTLLLDASMVMSSSDALKAQLQRIYDSANMQTESVELFAPLEFQSLKAGDFILAESDYFTDSRTHLGGIIATKEPGIYTAVIEDILMAFVINKTTVGNTIEFDNDNRLDSKGRIPFKVDDMLSLAITSDTIVYGVVSDVTVTSADIIVKFDVVKWVDDRGNWRKTGEKLNVPKDTIVSCYKIGGLSGVSYVYNANGVPVTVTSKVFTAPGDNRYGQLTILAQVSGGNTVMRASPMLFSTDTDKLWRVSSIEPLTNGFAFNHAKDSRDNAMVRYNEGYRVVATLYPWGKPKTYVTLPPSTATDNQQSVPPTTQTKDDVLDYLAEIATGNEFSNVEGVTHVWREGPITITVDGATTADQAAIDTVIAELQTLTGKTIAIVPGPTADIKLHVGPEPGFSAINPNYVSENLGFFWSDYGPNGDIVSGSVLIDNAKTDQMERNHLIREELTQLIVGLPDDSLRYADSIFYQPWTRIQTYSELDKQIIRLMSGPSVTSGLNSTQLRAVVT